MAEILWHRRETRRQTEKTNICLNGGKAPVYSPGSPVSHPEHGDTPMAWRLLRRLPVDTRAGGGVPGPGKTAGRGHRHRPRRPGLWQRGLVPALAFSGHALLAAADTALSGVERRGGVGVLGLRSGGRGGDVRVGEHATARPLPALRHRWQTLLARWRAGRWSGAVSPPAKTGR